MEAFARGASLEAAAGPVIEMMEGGFRLRRELGLELVVSVLRGERAQLAAGDALGELAMQFGGALESRVAIQRKARPQEAAAFNRLCLRP